MLSFNLISEQKAKNKLMCLHAQILSKYVSQFSKKLERLYQSCNDEDKKKSITEFLGTAYVTLNQIQQIKHEFQLISNSIHNKVENFMVKDEIMYSLEILSVNCMSKKSTLNLKTDDVIPDVLAGDVSKFRLAIQSVTEFAMKYCEEGEIDI